VIGHRPADDAAAEEVLDGDQVQPALPGSEIRDVGDPEPIARRREERAIDEVPANANARHPDRRLAALVGD
jgi:hypothetical protein